MLRDNDIYSTKVTVEQPMFGANYIKGKVRAQPNGNFIGEVKFKLTFKVGGAIEFGQAMLKAAHLGLYFTLFIYYFRNKHYSNFMNK